MDEDVKHWSYVATRLIELICIAAVIFGALWEGTELFNLSLPQFLMLYGAMGAVVSELLARLLGKKKPEKKEGVKHQ